MLAAEQFTPTAQQWLVLGLLGLVLGIWVLAKWRTRPRDGSPRAYRREIDSANRQVQEVRDDLATLLTELQRLSTNINAQLDDKYARLHDAVRDADQRIFALRALKQAAEAPRTDDVAPAAEPTAPSPPEESFISRVHSLADEGLTPHEIAGRVEHPVGEVQLILNLRAAANRE